MRLLRGFVGDCLTRTYGAVESPNTGLMPAPLVIELFAGLFGWGEGFVAEGYRSIGFDIVKMGPVPDGCELILQDVLTLSGAQFKNATCIVASPPCTDYAKWGMRMFHPNPPQPDKKLWEAALRIANEANLPLVIENVRGAQYFWGKANWKCGPYYLWGSIPALWPQIPLKRKNVVDDVKNGVRRKLPVAGDYGSHSDKRKECTAQAAKIPFALARHIAATFKNSPTEILP